MKKHIFFKLAKKENSSQVFLRIFFQRQFKPFDSTFRETIFYLLSSLLTFTCYMPWDKTFFHVVYYPVSARIPLQISGILLYRAEMVKVLAPYKWNINSLKICGFPILFITLSRFLLCTFSQIFHSPLDIFLLSTAKKISDAKGRSGIGRLTKTRIGIKQNYYGGCILYNQIHVEKMSCGDILGHVFSIEDNLNHEDCPASLTSWRSYQTDLTNEAQKHRVIKNTPSFSYCS